MRRTLIAVVAIAVNSVGAASDPGIYSPSPEWLTRQWAQKDPFAGLREEVEAEYKAAPNKRDFVAELGRNRRRSSRQTFRYVVGGYLLSQQDPAYSLKGPYVASLELHVPTSREVARAMFLISADYDWSPDLCAVGERLLNSHEEFAVRYQLTRMRVLAIESSRDRYELALSAAKTLVQKYPTPSKVHAVLGNVHYWGFVRLHIRADRAKALSEFKSYIASGPPDARYVKLVRRFIAELEAAGK